jgi:hypothetical protein
MLQLLKFRRQFSFLAIFTCQTFLLNGTSVGRRQNLHSLLLEITVQAVSFSDPAR